MGAIVTADSGKSLTQVAVFDRIIGLNPQDWPVKTVFCAVASRIDALELIINSS